MSSAEIALRAPTEEDIPELAAYFAAMQKERGVGGMAEARIRNELGRTADKNLQLALADGRIVGWASMWHPEEGSERVFLELKIHPLDTGIAARLLDWAEERARMLTAGEGAYIRSGALSDEEPLLELHRERGYILTRHFLTMEIDLADEPPEPDWPQGFELRTFRPEDGRPLYEVDREAFEDHWDSFEIPYEEFRSYFLDASDFDPELVFLAEDAGEIAGFSICRSETKPGVGHVAVLGVRRPWRGRGLGTALLLHSFRELRRRGRKKADLGVDAENLTGAVRLYERAGMHVANQYDAYQKPL